MDATTAASILADGNERYGTTEYVADLICQAVGGDVHRIETVTKYTADFNELRDVNHEEMRKGILPELKESNLDVFGYDTVFVGYPVWATDVPQAVLAFLNEYDLSGKTVIPFCTHDGYGAGSSYRTIEEASHAGTFLEGIAIEAKDAADAQETVVNWLTSIGISASKKQTETAVLITVGDITLEGILYNTALAEEIKAYFPLTISMVRYGGREYYGGVDFYPEHLEGGQRNFANGEITYCEAHHNMAIFYAQTDHPDLSVDVIPIGRITSDLSVFDILGSREEITFSLIPTPEPTGTPAPTPTTEPTEIPAPSEVQESKVLVVYFSATNTTEGVAEHIANGLNADIYEIIPEVPYTAADLNYNDNNSRTTIEMNDPASRPAISGSVEHMEQYDIVFIGYPIWLAYHNLIQCTQG